MKFLPQLFPGWLRFRAEFHELERVKQIPIRKYDGANWTVPDTARVRDYLTRCGAGSIPASPPIPKMGQPRFKTAPRAHQVDDLDLMDGKHAFAVLDEPGLGKSKVLIDDSTRWFDHGKIDAVIVVCPNSVTENWLDEVDIHSPVPADKHNYNANRKKAAEKWIRSGPQAGELRWFVVAVESLSEKSALLHARAFAKRHRALIVVDESTYIKTQSANRTKNVIRLAHECIIRRILTGTMLTRSLEGAWSQFEVLDPRILNMDFYPFRGYFSIMGGYKKKAAIASKNESDFFDIIAPWVCLKKKKDCLDLPEKTFQVRKVAPSDEQRKRYNDILSGVDNDPSFSVAMVRDLRLHQLTGGFTYRIDIAQAMAFLLKEIEALKNGTDLPDPDDLDTKYIAEPIPGPNPKVIEALNIADEMPGKVIFWCRYRAEIDAIARALRSEYGVQAVVEFHGGIPKDERQPIIRAFQNDPEVRYFIGQIHTGGIGITLTAASVEAFFSNDWSAERRIQAEDRTHRISQVGDACLYIDILLGDDQTPSGGFVDSRVLRSVQMGKDYHAFVQDEITERKKLLPAPETVSF